MSIDLEAIVGSGWVTLEELEPDDMHLACKYWAQTRARDPELQLIQRHATERVYRWTGRHPANIGSSALLLNTASSDLDLGIGIPKQLWECTTASVGALQEARCESTRFGNTRLAHGWTEGNVEIDLTILDTLDFQESIDMMNRIRRQMRRDERIAFTWIKHLLEQSGNAELRRRWKLAPYMRYCSDFSPIKIVNESAE
ncbi:MULTISPECIES: hypothetical protein [Nocardia]|uniref:hypothetical protein n=1 Tax=Nocardia TaxID=1817 RepID=UPI000FD86644|nr:MULTISPECIES: hypothetical protein [Nocardia]MBF6187034.1 hypothetical protein [Nocardia farcinica]MBF6312681.1 hypothetical protein [Nocardia farcinica]MBF6408464.1 hypothetical protein [Nocardia farcinica]UEX23549.1 hypothetical protein LMJ57_03335 [Nocardia farcinica]